MASKYDFQLNKVQNEYNTKKQALASEEQGVNSIIKSGLQIVNQIGSEYGDYQATEWIKKRNDEYQKAIADGYFFNDENGNIITDPDAILERQNKWYEDYENSNPSPKNPWAKRSLDSIKTNTKESDTADAVSSVIQNLQSAKNKAYTADMSAIVSYNIQNPSKYNNDTIVANGLSIDDLTDQERAWMDRGNAQDSAKLAIALTSRRYGFDKYQADMIAESNSDKISDNYYVNDMLASYQMNVIEGNMNDSDFRSKMNADLTQEKFSETYSGILTGERKYSLSTAVDKGIKSLVSDATIKADSYFSETIKPAIQDAIFGIETGNATFLDSDFFNKLYSDASGMGINMNFLSKDNKEYIRKIEDNGNAMRKVNDFYIWAEEQNKKALEGNYNNIKEIEDKLSTFTSKERAIILRGQDINPYLGKYTQYTGSQLALIAANDLDFSKAKPIQSGDININEMDSDISTIKEYEYIIDEFSSSNGEISPMAIQLATKYAEESGYDLSEGSIYDFVTGYIVPGIKTKKSNFYSKYGKTEEFLKSYNTDVYKIENNKIVKANEEEIENETSTMLNNIYAPLKALYSISSEEGLTERTDKMLSEIYGTDSLPSIIEKDESGKEREIPYEELTDEQKKDILVNTLPGNVASLESELRSIGVTDTELSHSYDKIKYSVSLQDSLSKQMSDKISADRRERASGMIEYYKTEREVLDDYRKNGLTNDNKDWIKAIYDNSDYRYEGVDFDELTENQLIEFINNTEKSNAETHNFIIGSGVSESDINSYHVSAGNIIEISRMRSKETKKEDNRVVLDIYGTACSVINDFNNSKKITGYVDATIPMLAKEFGIAAPETEDAKFAFIRTLSGIMPGVKEQLVNAGYTIDEINSVVSSKNTNSIAYASQNQSHALEFLDNNEERNNQILGLRYLSDDYKSTGTIDPVLRQFINYLIDSDNEIKNEDDAIEYIETESDSIYEIMGIAGYNQTKIDKIKKEAHVDLLAPAKKLANDMSAVSDALETVMMLDSSLSIMYSPKLQNLKDSYMNEVLKSGTLYKEMQLEGASSTKEYAESMWNTYISQKYAEAKLIIEYVDKYGSEDTKKLVEDIYDDQKKIANNVRTEKDGLPHAISAKIGVPSYDTSRASNVAAIWSNLASIKDKEARIKYFESEVYSLSSIITLDEFNNMKKMAYGDYESYLSSNGVDIDKIVENSYIKSMSESQATACINTLYGDIWKYIDSNGIFNSSAFVNHADDVIKESCGKILEQNAYVRTSSGTRFFDITNPNNASKQDKRGVLDLAKDEEFAGLSPDYEIEIASSGIDNMTPQIQKLFYSAEITNDDPGAISSKLGLTIKNADDDDLSGMAIEAALSVFNIGISEYKKGQGISGNSDFFNDFYNIMSSMKDESQKITIMGVASRYYSLAKNIQEIQKYTDSVYLSDDKSYFISGDRKHIYVPNHDITGGRDFDIYENSEDTQLIHKYIQNPLLMSVSSLKVGDVSEASEASVNQAIGDINKYMSSNYDIMSIVIDNLSEEEFQRYFKIRNIDGEDQYILQNHASSGPIKVNIGKLSDYIHDEDIIRRLENINTSSNAVFGVNAIDQDVSVVFSMGNKESFIYLDIPTYYNKGKTSISRIGTGSIGKVYSDYYVR